MEHLTNDAIVNIATAYCTLVDLEKTAKECGLRPTSMITEKNDGDLYFCVTDIGARLGATLLKGITVKDAETFSQEAAEFRDYWAGLMIAAKDTNAARISELKKELARLEGRA